MNVTPLGSAPLSLNVGVGIPVVVTVKLPLLPTVNVVLFGLVIAGGYVIARVGDVGWASLAVTLGAIALMLGTRINPLWLIAAGGALGGLGAL